MRGYTHALTGAAAWLALTSSSAAALGSYPLATAGVLSGAAITAGAALQPDLDSNQSTIAHSLPVVSKGLTKLVGAISGGHRVATHSIVGIAVLTAIAWGVCQIPPTTIGGRVVHLGPGIYVVILAAFAFKALELSTQTGQVLSRTGFDSAGGLLRSVLGPWIVALATVGLLTWYSGFSWPWLPQSVALGALLHLLGDGLTVEGVPWLWPWRPGPPRWLRKVPGVTVLWGRNGYFRLPLLGRVSSSIEAAVGYVLTLYVAYLVAYEGVLATGVKALW